MADTAFRQDYWRRNLRYVGLLLIVWFLVSFGLGILFVDQANRIRVGGFRLGFWFAQQGSIYVFVVLIFVYAAKTSATSADLGTVGAQAVRRMDRSWSPH